MSSHPFGNVSSSCSVPSSFFFLTSSTPLALSFGLKSIRKNKKKIEKCTIYAHFTETKHTISNILNTQDFVNICRALWIKHFHPSGHAHCPHAQTPTLRLFRHVSTKMDLIPSWLGVSVSLSYLYKKGMVQVWPALCLQLKETLRTAFQTILIPRK